MLDPMFAADGRLAQCRCFGEAFGTAVTFNKVGSWSRLESLPWPSSFIIFMDFFFFFVEEGDKPSSKSDLIRDGEKSSPSKFCRVLHLFSIDNFFQTSNQKLQIACLNLSSDSVAYGFLIILCSILIPFARINKHLHDSSISLENCETICISSCLRLLVFQVESIKISLHTQVTSNLVSSYVFIFARAALNFFFFYQELPPC